MSRLLILKTYYLVITFLNIGTDIASVTAPKAKSMYISFVMDPMPAPKTITFLIASIA